MRLFKYVTKASAKAILGNSKLRWSAPRMFNDPFDVQFDLHVDFNDAHALELILDQVWQIYSGQKKIEPANTLGIVLQALPVAAPGLSRKQLLNREGLKDALRESLTLTRTLLPDLHAYQRELLADVKILCLSEAYNNILMWSHYSENHMGAVLEFEWDELSQSPFTKAKKVNYSEAMPRLMTTETAVAFFSGQAKLDANEVFHNSIFVKAQDWAYEKEWRIWLPGAKASDDFQEVNFDASELVAIYMGCRMPEKDRKIITALAEKTFAGIEIYHATKSEREFALTFWRAN